MAQVTDRTVGANPTGFDMRTELNNIIAALESDNSGSSEPLNTVAYMKWLDTSNATYYYYKERNHDNTTWVTLFRYTVATKIMEVVSNGVVLQDSTVVHKTGDETIAGVKRFTANPVSANATEAIIALEKIGTGASVFYPYNGTTQLGLADTVFGIIAYMNKATPSDFTVNKNLYVSGSLLLNTGGGLGYGAGSGGTVTQLTSKSTAVTLNKPCGRITMNGASLASNTGIAFQLNNSLIGLDDLIIANVDWDGTGDPSKYSVDASCYTAGGVALIYVKNITAGSLAEAISINFAIIKGETA